MAVTEDIPVFEDKECKIRAKSYEFERQYTGTTTKKEYYLKNPSNRWHLIHVKPVCKEKDIKIKTPTAIKPNGIGVMIIEWSPKLSRESILSDELFVIGDLVVGK